MPSPTRDRRGPKGAGLSNGSPCGPATLQDLAAEYSRTHQARIQDEIVEACWQWASRLGRGVARHSGVEPEVIEQVAGLALCRALARYDPRIGDFEVFARATVAGEVRHFLRSVVWPIHVPRVLQERYRLVAKAQDDLVQDLQCEPTAGAVAEAVGLPLRMTEAAIGLKRTCASLDEGSERMLAVGDDDLDRVPDRVDLIRAMRQMNDGDRQLLELRFYEGFTQAEIAGMLSTNQVKVSRMLARALLRLRHLLGESREPDLSTTLR